MKFSLTRVLLVAVIVVMSVAIGNISTIIKVHFDPDKQLTLKNKDIFNNSTISSNSQGKRNSKSFEDLIWFLQISDIHISIFRNADRLTELEEFCEKTIDAIRPAVVLASGDLTDGKSVDTLGSQQYEDEWKMYWNALNKYQVSKKTVWLDVRGNHDNFNVPGPSAKENYYRNYSMQGGTHPRSYLHIVRSQSGKIFSFIALDACLEPGPKRPFNFVGLVNGRETEHLKSLIREAAAAGSSHSVWFGHYPTSCIMAAGQGVRSLIASDPAAQAYLCGHLHSLAGLVPHMYTLQQKGFLELELADWKDSRVFRLAAIDHGLFSFIDVPHGEWPIALITNPKHTLFHIPNREPHNVTAASTHIRVLAFSTSNIVSVKVQVDQEGWQACSHVKGPLYVAPWQPAEYQRGLHNIKVWVTDASGREKVLEQPFSLDNTRLHFNIFPRILLMTNFTSIFQALFGLSILGCVLPLCCLRLLLARIRAGDKHIPRTSIHFIRGWYRKLWILANLDTFYYPLILYPIYITFGPWTIGEIIENHIGVIFAWGTFINGAYLPGSFTYGYGFFQVVTYHGPFMLVLAHKLDKRLQPAAVLDSRLLYTLRHWWADLPLYVLALLQALFLYFFWLSYGSLAILLGPFRSWPIIATVYLWRRVCRVPLHHIQELSDIFHEAYYGSPRTKPSHSI